MAQRRQVDIWGGNSPCMGDAAKCTKALEGDADQQSPDRRVSALHVTHSCGLPHHRQVTGMRMLPLQVSGSPRDWVSIGPNFPVAKKPQAPLLVKPESRVAPGLLPRRFTGSPSSLHGSPCSGSWRLSHLLGLESSCWSPTGTATASVR